MVNLENRSGTIKTIRMLTINEWSKLIRDEVALLVDRKSRNCLNCMHFDDATQMCRLANAIPPPKVAVNGCEMWDEEIPF